MLPFMTWVILGRSHKTGHESGQNRCIFGGFVTFDVILGTKTDKLVGKTMSGTRFCRINRIRDMWALGFMTSGH